MNSLSLLIATLVLYILAYRLYGSWISKRFQLNPKNPTPAHTQFDGTDFVPTKNWFVLFGHHFSSICGAGPIVGPVLAVAYWGWMPSLIWIVFGAIFFGAVSDFTSLIVSVRHKGQSISEIAKTEISPLARLLFSWFIWIVLILVVAVFGIFGAKTLNAAKESVIPSVGLVPVALVFGFLALKKLPTSWNTILGLTLFALLLWLGKQFPLALFENSFLGPMNTWIVILLIYCLVASVMPVQFLLQPRDYLASYLLVGTILMGVMGVIVVHPTFQTQAYHGWNPSSLWPGSGPLFPMLFVTIACGAISGFHSLVSSGTTCKQLDHEGHACRIGYGSMLTESFVAILVLICAGAALSTTDLSATLKTGGPIAAFAKGFGTLTEPVLGNFGKSFAILALNMFILTTLDSATRITRYLTMDLMKIKNKYIATLIVVGAAGAFAMSGSWNKIWPIFGSANQLIGGLALLVTSCYLINKKQKSWFTLIPALIMLIITVSALSYQMISTWNKTQPDYWIIGVGAVLIVLAIVVFGEALKIKKL